MNKSIERKSGEMWRAKNLLPKWVVSRCWVYVGLDTGFKIQECLWVKRMDEEEKKFGSKRRLKQIDLGFDSNDVGSSGSAFMLRIQANPPPW